jgi:hypothetical protein
MQDFPFDVSPNYESKTEKYDRGRTHGANGRDDCHADPAVPGIFS